MFSTGMAPAQLNKPHASSDTVRRMFTCRPITGLTSQQGRATTIWLTTPPLKPLIPTLSIPSPTWVMAPPSPMQHYRMSFGHLRDQSGELGGDLSNSGGCQRRLRPSALKRPIQHRTVHEQ